MSPSSSPSASTKVNTNTSSSVSTDTKINTNLRDHLLAALATVPGTRTFHLHTLVTAPRKSNALFPFAKPRPPRVYLQDILLVLSEEATPDAPRVIVAAVEACVYTNPTTHCAVFYVSKVDSTGHGAKGLPAPTAVLVRALIRFYVDPATRPVQAEHMWVQLFARAQAQYLFPNSNEWEGKKPLSDTKLCAWWKRALTRVAVDVEEAAKKKEKEVKIKMYYILPGYNESEAEDTLRIASSSSAGALPETGLGWEYGHPYSQTEIPLPCPADVSGEKIKNLGHFIPTFEDDPKSRFMDEIAYTTDGEIRSPQRKRARTLNGERTEQKEATSNTTEDAKPLGELGKVTADEFWERMSFRQECVAGAVTGFFTVVVSCKREQETGESPLAPQTGQVAGQVHKRVMTTLLTGVEFSTLERAVRGTETVEGAIRGLCEGIPKSGRRTPEPRERRLLEPPRTPPRGRRTATTEISPNPFPEPVGSLETYMSHVYGAVATRNAVVGEAGHSQAAVRELKVRRRNK
ncbi:hypothetical protein GALMADRAFT_841760 [Galerina marginata CBS 339.88]|uniref:histone acetyltransferase n=1 Tax=Galerina marginata (strain CBS 339.88) TaxID=685588 RepID=A0A067TUQ0_GALM3|nr:hypothetical protein GALMADRAFT_841760 [Galerina marginata CBS 339.88]